MVDNPFSGISSFIFPQDAGPLNARAMENRRQIALALATASARKPYPKTVGEGLAAIGDAIGTKGIMNQLAQQEAAYQKQADIEAQKSIPDEARPATPAPASTSDAGDTTPAVTPPSNQASVFDRGTTAIAGLPPVVARDDSEDAAPSPVGAATQGPSPADVATAQRSIGFNPVVRNNLTSALMQQQRGGLQLNPTLAGDATSPDLQATQTPSQVSTPTAGSNTQLAMAEPSGTVMSDIKPAPTVPLRPPAVQFAQSGAPPPLPRPPAPATAVPQNVEPRMPLPTDIPMTADEKRGWQIRARGLALGDPDITAQGQNLINQGQQQQKQLYDTMVRKYQDQMAIYNQRIGQQEEYQRGGIKPGEADIYARTGLQPAEFWKKMDTAKAAIDSTIQGQDAQTLARKAIKAGVITGYGADFKVAAAKFADWALKNGMSGDLASNTETMRAMLQAGLRQAVATVNGPGGTGVSNTDVRIAEGMTGSDPALQQRTILNIIDRAAEINNRNIDRYEAEVERYLRGHPQEAAYKTNPRPVAPPEDLKAMLDAQNDPAKAAMHRFYFDRAYGPGAAALEISRAGRRQRESAR